MSSGGRYRAHGHRGKVITSTGIATPSAEGVEALVDDGDGSDGGEADGDDGQRRTHSRGGVLAVDGDALRLAAILREERHATLFGTPVCMGLWIVS